MTVGGTDAWEDDVGSGREVARIWRSRACIRWRKSFRLAFHVLRIDACICCLEVGAALFVTKVFSSDTMRSDNVIIVIVSEEGGISGFSVAGSAGSDECVDEFCVKESVMAVDLASGVVGDGDEVAVGGGEGDAD